MQKKSVKVSSNFSNTELNNNFKTRKHKKKPKNFSDNDSYGNINSGVYYKGNKFITHTDLHHRHSAIQTFHLHQKIILALLGGVF